MEYAYIKALHIIFVVSWFSALFYIVRLFIYTREAQDKDPVAGPILTQQLLIMQKRLWYIIGWPSMFLSLGFGLWMLVLNPVLLTLPWMWLKLIAVSLLLLYHLECQRIHKQQKQGVFRRKSIHLRLFNELATVFLVVIVFLVVLKSTSGFIWGTLGMFAFAALLMMIVFIVRKQNNNDSLSNQK
ncbi:MAG TPA: CopD family protein [Bacteroidia bacterium]|nr:CopD family protein [Bacteroidia bacterium]